MSRKLFGAAGVVAFFTLVSQAALITYTYEGTIRDTVPWSWARGEAVSFAVTIDTEAVASVVEPNRRIYEGAVVNGYFELMGHRFEMADSPSTNQVIVRTDVFDQNTSRFSNRYDVTFSSDGIDRGPFQFPGNIFLSIIDNDRPADTVLDLGLDQPLDTAATFWNGGGFDSIGISMGVIANNISSTLTSNNGTIGRVIPTPGTLALAGLAGLGMLRHRRRA